MPTDNSEQIADWNGAMGRLWAESQREIDAVVVPFGIAALATAAPKAGEQVIDVGCGCGDTTIEIARMVGERGHVLGVDVSHPMLEVAQLRASQTGCRNVQFREADASTAQLPSGIDLLFSRFGVMFFSQPMPAFRHLRASLRAGGRCVFVCWRAPRDNAWAMAPLAAARAAMAVTPPPADPDAAGPFAFADEARVRSVLTEAGFAGIEFRRFDQLLSLGETAQEATEYAMRIGPTSRFAREMGDDHRPIIRRAVEQAFAHLAAPDGRVTLVGSAWIVSATNPA